MYIIKRTFRSSILLTLNSRIWTLKVIHGFFLCSALSKKSKPKRASERRTLSLLYSLSPSQSLSLSKQSQSKTRQAKQSQHFSSCLDTCHLRSFQTLSSACYTTTNRRYYIRNVKKKTTYGAKHTFVKGGGGDKECLLGSWTILDELPMLLIQIRYPTTARCRSFCLLRFRPGPVLSALGESISVAVAVAVSVVV